MISNAEYDARAKAVIITLQHINYTVTYKSTAGLYYRYNKKEAMH